MDDTLPGAVLRVVGQNLALSDSVFANLASGVGTVAQLLDRKGGDMHICRIWRTALISPPMRMHADAHVFKWGC